eukprot:SM000005S17123  [mRNA]  locus=s5:223750:224514:- [translate_table: standard]
MSELAWKPAQVGAAHHIHALKEITELVRHAHSVVDARQHHILDKDATTTARQRVEQPPELATGPGSRPCVQVQAEGLEDAVDGVRSCRWHDAATQFLHRRVQRERKVDARQLHWERQHPRDDTHLSNKQAGKGLESEVFHCSRSTSVKKVDYWQYLTIKSSR